MKSTLAFAAALFCAATTAEARNLLSRRQPSRPSYDPRQQQTLRPAGRTEYRPKRTSAQPTRSYGSGSNRRGQTHAWARRANNKRQASTRRDPYNPQPANTRSRPSVNRYTQRRRNSRAAALSRHAALRPANRVTRGYRRPSVQRYEPARQEKEPEPASAKDLYLLAAQVQAILEDNKAIKEEVNELSMENMGLADQVGEL